ncbi:hypothetical protein [Methylocystis echinoides]|nr:hypothetical protein [Methylocystis echinoides]
MTQDARLGWLRLGEAADLIGVSIKTLRREATRGRLRTWRVGNKDFTSLDEIERMKDTCQQSKKESTSGSSRRESTKDTKKRASGSSRTVEEISAQDALKAKLEKLTDASQTTSPRSGKSRGSNVIFLK